LTLSNLWRQRNHYGSSCENCWKRSYGGGDLRLNTRKLKVKAYQKSSWFYWSWHYPLDMGNKLYVTKVPPDHKSCTQTTQ
jgi:hypothetical protein